MDNKHIKKYLMFLLNNQKYAVPLSNVKEVIALTQFTAVPTAPTHVLGLINLRGKVISAIDLKCCLSMSYEQRKDNEKSTLILSECDNSTFACRVDSIEEVITIADEQIEQMDAQSGQKKNLYMGVARMKNEEMIIIINIHEVKSQSDLSSNAENIENTLAQAA